MTIRAAIKKKKEKFFWLFIAHEGCMYRDRERESQGFKALLS